MSTKNPGLVLITGASSGIGAELARVCARARHDLVLVARSREALEALAEELARAYGIAAHVMAQDLGVAGAAAKLHGEVRARGLVVEILVNNAGFGLMGDFVSLSAERQREMIALNVTALTELCQLFGADMAALGEGKILNVASVAAFSPGPLMAVYFATKAYVLSLSVALDAELSGRGVSVFCLCPGPTETRFSQTASAAKTKLFARGPMSAARVAEGAYAALTRKDRVVILGLKNRLIAFMTRLVSRPFAARVTQKLLEDL